MQSQPSLLVFRYDDYGVAEGQTFAVERALVEMFARVGLPVVFGVIPQHFERSQTKIDYLRPFVDAGQVELALHGWSHEYQPELYAAQGIKSEFLARPYAEQYTRIADGQRLLAQIFERPVRCFIPPWNRYDLATLQICSELEFDVLSADIDGPYSPSIARPALLPSTVALPAFENLLERWERAAKAARVAVLCFHAFEFVESGDPRAVISLAAFEPLLQRAARSSQIQSLTMSEAARRLGQTLTARRYDAAQRTFRSARSIYQRRLPTRVGSRLRLLTNLDSAGYETEKFYVIQELKHRLLNCLPHASLTLCVLLTMLAVP